MVQFTKKWNQKWISNIKDTFEKILQLQMSVLHQRMSIFQFSRLVSQVHMMAGQNANKTYLMCQIRIKILKQHATPNSGLHNLKIYSSAEKLVKDEYMQLASYVATYLANTAVLNIRILSRIYHFRLKVFAWTGEFISY